MVPLLLISLPTALQAVGREIRRLGGEPGARDARLASQSLGTFRY